MSDQQLIELETRYLYLENTIESLNQVVIDQQKQLNEMQKTLSYITKNLKHLLEQSADIRPNEKPPHY